MVKPTATKKEEEKKETPPTTTYGEYNIIPFAWETKRQKEIFAYSLYCGLG